jgi:hypothetical protein
MQEYKTAGQQQAEPTPVTVSRFDPRRIYTILVLAPLLYAVIRYLPPLAFSGVVALAGALALFEFYRIHRPDFWNTLAGHRRSHSPGHTRLCYFGPTPQSLPP